MHYFSIEGIPYFVKIFYVLLLIHAISSKTQEQRGESLAQRDMPVVSATQQPETQRPLKPISSETTEEQGQIPSQKGDVFFKDSNLDGILEDKT